MNEKNNLKYFILNENIYLRSTPRLRIGHQTKGVLFRALEKSD